MEQPLMLQNECVDCPCYEGFGQCYHYGNITDEIQKECVFKMIDMKQYISKSALVAEIERLKTIYNDDENIHHVAKYNILVDILSFINTLEVIDPYEQCIQYPTVKDGIEAHAEVYSFNIESELFNQLTKEQQKLWRKEIEQACISGGNAGYLLARDPRYKDTLEVKEVDLDFQMFAKEMDIVFALPSSETKNTEEKPLNWEYAIAKHFFELGVRVNNPITAADRGMVEEIITHLKRVENDYRINLTREMEWLKKIK